jgi:nucleotide-binding universal stress UspA family protein
MHKAILIVVDGASSDRAMVEYVKPLARLMQSRIILFHIENQAPYGRRREPLYPGAIDSVDYLKKMQGEFQAADVSIEIALAYGEPGMEIKNQLQKGTCDLVVMNTHECKSVSEIFFGTIFERVQNVINVPALLFKLK